MALRDSFSSSGIAQLALLGAIWGVTFPIARVGVQAGADPVLLVALDLLLATAVMASAAAVTRTQLPHLREMAQSAGLGALLIGGINLTLYWGLQFATGGTASIVYATAPILSLVVLVILRAPVEIRLRQGAALAIGLGGVVLLGIATTQGSLVAGLGALAAFGLGAACQGTGAVLVARSRPHGENRWGLTSQFVGGAVAAFVLLPLLSRSPTLAISAATVGSIAFVGVVTMAFGYSLFFSMIQRFGAIRANQVTFLNPVVALVIGVFAFGEGFQPIEAVALACIVVALGLLQPRTKPRPSAPSPPGLPLSDAAKPG